MLVCQLLLIFLKKIRCDLIFEILLMGVFMNYRSIVDLDILINNNIQKIPHDIDLIVGVPRSGLLVANILALKLNKRLADLDGFINNRFISSGKTKNLQSFNGVIKKVLVVEDSVGSGSSIIGCKKKLMFMKNYEFIYFAAYVEPGTEKYVDICFEVLKQPRLFEWNLFHHRVIISNSCFDLDGVLCEDPDDYQNDDGKNYLYFLSNVKPKFLPSVKIDKIVTSRLEKYRNETEEWLKKYNVDYNELIMLDSTAEERKEKKLHAIFKANVYKNCSNILFVESNIEQAIEINEITGKSVFCVENNVLYDGVNKYLKNEKKVMNYSKSMNSSFIKRFLLKFKFVRWLNYKRKLRKK